jgi:hypothetical protein
MRFVMPTKLEEDQGPIEYPCEKDMIFPVCIRSREDLNWGQKSFLAELISIDHLSNGKCYYSLDNMADRFFVTRVTIHSWIKKLIQLGLIDVTSIIEEGGGVRRVIKPILFRVCAR